MRRSLARAVAVAVVSLLAAAPARAQNLLTNPSFESGLTGWYTSGWPGYTIGVASPCPWTPDAPRYAPGVACATIQTPGTPGGFGSFSQNFATTPGHRYYAEIQSNAFPGHPGAYFVLSGGHSWAGMECSTETLVGPCTASIMFDALGTSNGIEVRVLSLLSGGETQPPFTLTFDAAYVEDMGLTANFTAAPEPASLALLGTGLAGLGLVARRRRRA